MFEWSQWKEQQKVFILKICDEMLRAPRARYDLLPMFGRIIAILSQYYNDIGVRIMEILEEEFNFLSQDLSTLKPDARNRNARFISELVKFKICSPSKCFQLIEKCLDSFISTNVDVVCTLLQSCGGTKAEAILERMWRNYKLKAHLLHVNNRVPFGEKLLLQTRVKLLAELHVYGLVNEERPYPPHIITLMDELCDLIAPPQTSPRNNLCKECQEEEKEELEEEKEGSKEEEIDKKDNKGDTLE
ncbi:MAG: putative ARM repeat-containing protein [Streblomastix strix]|uniref:Putative ARM repeat-containing protein n=1 Tax=Streblomastix strix TaxID=222440 RepID=A0A5J4W2V1_9EUKA|nr:MAG: putative ARM repeat-containing protein [Streblomastix strix]